MRQIDWRRQIIETRD